MTYRDIKALIIPTADTLEENIERAERLIQYRDENNLRGVPFILSGMGEGLEFKKDFYNYFMERTKDTGEYVGVDRLSVNSIQNIKNCFPPGVEKGRYVMSTYKTHSMRFRFINWFYRIIGKTSREIDVEYILTKESLTQKIYGFAAFFKTIPQVIFGSRELSLSY